ncbi:MAG: hypothetical protein WA057_00030 [Candidatus Magasanikiibacteriota bacterium]
MSKKEVYSDDKGNEVSIDLKDDGVYVGVRNTTAGRYSGGASADRARDHAKRYGLQRRKGE